MGLHQGPAGEQHQKLLRANQAALIWKKQEHQERREDKKGRMAVPEMMLGSFQMETSGGFDEFVYELGVNMFTRKIANNLYPLQEIRMEEGEMCIDTFTSFKNTKTKFPLGPAWEEYTADGRTTQTVTTIEGNTIVKVQTPDAATGYHTTREEREFSDDGATMTLRLIIPAKPEIVCNRIYKRVIPTPEGESEEKTEEPAEENVAQW